RPSKCDDAPGLAANPLRQAQGAGRTRHRSRRPRAPAPRPPGVLEGDLLVNPSQFRELTYKLDAGVAVVTLNRPETRNLWSGRMAVEYRWALHHADQDPAARVVVVAGAGSNFCAG